MQPINDACNAPEPNSFANGFDIVEALSTLKGATDTVPKLATIENRLKELVRHAEHDLLTYYDPSREAFTRLPTAPASKTRNLMKGTDDGVSSDSPENSKFNVTSNASAVIALEMYPKSDGLWNEIQDKVVNNLQTRRSESRVLPRENIFTASMIAVALKACGKEYPETIEKKSDVGLTGGQEWPFEMIRNIKKYSGGAAIESMVPEPIVHPRSTYWTVRALSAYRMEIRGMDAKVDRRIDQSMQFSAKEAHRLWLDKERNDWDAVSFAFALATLWHQCEGSGEKMHIPGFSPRDALNTIMARQLPDGTWKPGKPLYGLDSRTYVYPFPADILYGLYDAMPSLLMKREIYADDVLTELQLNGMIRFLDWAEKNRFQYAEQKRSPSEPGQYYGWASSAEPGATYPECWATATVLRAAKALLGTIQEACSQIAFGILSQDEETTDLPCWKDAIVSQRVRTYFDDNVVGSPQEHWSAILAGPPGTGKTFLAKGIAAELARRDNKVPLFCSVSPDTVLSNAQNGQVHSELKRIFKILQLMHRGLVLLDEIDEFVLERDGAADEAFSRLTTTFMLPVLQNLRDQKRLTFLVGTNYIEKFDAAIRREGRFDNVIAIEMPDLVARRQFALKHFYSKLFKNPGSGLEYLLYKQLSDLSVLIGTITKSREWVKLLYTLQQFDGELFAFYHVAEEFFRFSLATSKTTAKSVRPLVKSLREFGNRQPTPVEETVTDAITEMTLWEDVQYFFHEQITAIWWLAQGTYYAWKSLTTEQHLCLLQEHLDSLQRCLSDVGEEKTQPLFAYHHVGLLFELFNRIEVRIQRDPRYQTIDSVGENEEKLIAAEYKRYRSRYDNESNMWSNCLKQLAGRLRDKKYHRRDHLTVQYCDEPMEKSKERILRSDWFECDTNTHSDQLAAYLKSDDFQDLIETRRASIQTREEAVVAVFDHFQTVQTAHLNRLFPPPTAHLPVDKIVAEGNQLKRILGQVGKLSKALRDARVNPSASISFADLSKQIADLQTYISRFPGSAARVSHLDDCRKTVLEYWECHLYPFAKKVVHHFDGCAQSLEKLQGQIDIFQNLEIEEKKVLCSALDRALDTMTGSFERWDIRISELNNILTKRIDPPVPHDCVFPRAAYFEDVDVVKTAYLSLLVHGGTAAQQKKMKGAKSIKNLMDISTPEQNAHILHRFMGKAKVWDGMDFVAAHQVLWEQSRFRRLFETVLDELFHELWRKDAAEPAHISTIPWPLARNGHPLRVGEFFTFGEINRAIGRFIKEEKLTKRSGLNDLYQTLLSGKTDDVKKKLRNAFEQEALQAKFYVEGEDVEWKLDETIPGKDKAHPRHKLLRMTPEQTKTLKEHQLLWSLRQDVLNDKDLRNHWPVDDELSKSAK